MFRKFLKSSQPIEFDALYIIFKTNGLGPNFRGGSDGGTY